VNGEGVVGLLEVTTTEQRLAATAAVALLAAAAGLLAPRVVRRALRAAHDSLVGDPAERDADADAVGIAQSLPGRVLARVAQLAVLGVAGLAVLVVWGRIDTALLALGAFLGSVPFALRLLVTVGLLVGAVVATRTLRNWLERYVDASEHVDRHQEGIVFRVLQVVLFAAVGLAALSLWEVDLGGLLVGAGFLGIVVGMAARQTLGSLIAGFVLMFSRPFEIGDWVEVDDREGVVTDITIVNTRIRNFDDETVILPNDRVSNATVINRTKRNRLRVRTRVGIDYDADLDRAEAAAEEAIGNVERVMRVPAPQIVPVEFADSQITLELRFWIDKPSARRRWQARAAVIRSVKAAFEEAGIEIPFPQRELSGRAGSVRVEESAGERPPEAAEE
jgi:small-conductance mechanosensitive channel